MDLPPYVDEWVEDDPHANFKHEVSLYTQTDPLPMFANLSTLTGIPLESLVRYVLVKWGTEGTEAILAAGPRLIRRLQAVCVTASAEGSVDARLAAFEQLSQMIGWLALPLDQRLDEE